MDPSASSGPGRGSRSTSSRRGIDDCRIPGSGDGLLADACDEELPIRIESSEGEDVASGDVPRGVRGTAIRTSGVSCDAWRERGDEGEFEVGAGGASSGR